MSDDSNQPHPLRISAYSVAAGGTVWAANITFSSTIVPGQTAIDKPEWIVSMPWPLAKAFLDVLRQTLDQYEKTEGPISLPTSYTQKRSGQEPA